MRNSGCVTDDTSRLADLERRLAAVEALLADGGSRASIGDPATTPAGSSASASDDRFWILDGVKRRLTGAGVDAGETPIEAERGAVVFAGAVSTARGPVEWQYGQTAEALLERDWEPFAAVLAALGHPVRLELLRAAVDGPLDTHELTERAELGSTGQLYHHLTPLVAQGWLVQSSRGRYVVPPERVVPLLAILTASGRIA
ncbi:winged helix-turn-helix transcriptional regulator [Schumannella sp. 10F1B-5-1]|nr:winged helix-turn-helix transcriptional regulator [Schumannella sp. 10F1B-5-1]